MTLGSSDSSSSVPSAAGLLCRLRLGPLGARVGPAARESRRGPAWARCGPRCRSARFEDAGEYIITKTGTLARQESCRFEDVGGVTSSGPHHVSSKRLKRVLAVFWFEPAAISPRPTRRAASTAQSTRHPSTCGCSLRVRSGFLPLEDHASNLVGPVRGRNRAPRAAQAVLASGR